MNDTTTLSVEMTKLLDGMDKQIAPFVSEKDANLSLDQIAKLWRSGQDIPGNASRPGRPFEQVTWVYICVNTIIKACRSIQCMLSTADDNVVESGPLWELLFSNKQMPFSKFVTETVGFLSLQGIVYWVFPERDMLKPKSILVVGKSQMRPKVQNGVLMAWEFQSAPGRWDLLGLEDVFPLAEFNPYNPLHGIGPENAAEIAISSAYQAARFNEATLANGARIGIVLTVPQGVQLKEEQVAMMRSQFENRHAGAMNAGRAFIASGGVDVKTVSQTMSELQLVELRRYDASEICAGFGVPPEVAGLNPDAQYAHGPSQSRLIVNTVSPLLSMIGEGITIAIASRFAGQRGLAVDLMQAKSYCGRRSKNIARPFYQQQKIKGIQSGSEVFAWFNIDAHPVIREMVRDRIAKLMPLVEKGIPLNQVIEAEDLPYDTSKIPWGNDYWVSMGLVPARSILAGEISPTGESLPEEEDGEPKKAIDLPDDAGPDCVKAQKDKRSRIWAKWASSWQPIEREYAESIRGLLRKQQKEILSKLESVLNESKSVKADTDQIIARVVFDLVEQNKKFKMVHRVFYEKASTLGIAQTLNEVQGLEGNDLKAAVKKTKLSLPVKQALERSSTNITKVNSSTRDWVSNQLRIGLEKREGLTELTDRLQSEFSRSRAARIARTQTSGAVSAGRYAGMKEAGVEKKGWLTSHDDVVRPEHRQAEQDYKAGIFLDQPFVVGGDRLMYPCDPSGSASQIANCRCLQIAILAGGKTFDLDYYVNIKFISWHEVKDWNFAA